MSRPAASVLSGGISRHAFAPPPAVDPRRVAAASARYAALRLAAVLAQRGDLGAARAIVARCTPGSAVVIEVNNTQPLVRP